MSRELQLLKDKLRSSLGVPKAQMRKEKDTKENSSAHQAPGVPDEGVVSSEGHHLFPHHLWDRQTSILPVSSPSGLPQTILSALPHSPSFLNSPCSRSHTWWASFFLQTIPPSPPFQWCAWYNALVPVCHCPQSCVTEMLIHTFPIFPSFALLLLHAEDLDCQLLQTGTCFLAHIKCHAKSWW